ncbi:hypothetical protein An08g04940 [Aspergillus niger]|uniref:Uncharacterized protein n=2 Tax=Aspergillus niger TaxID=5061 RepID=A2QR66_ASPNC|nr:hypothetical protein An08g04940 [Aspergillus niger]CAK45467.1 hypothetical protein An08g04940 [Aspergillus niger]
METTNEIPTGGERPRAEVMTHVTSPREMMYRVAEKDVVVPDVQMRGNMHGCIKEPAKDTGLLVGELIAGRRILIGNDGVTHSLRVVAVVVIVSCGVDSLWDCGLDGDRVKSVSAGGNDDCCISSVEFRNWN